MIFRSTRHVARIIVLLVIGFSPFFINSNFAFAVTIGDEPTWRELDTHSFAEAKQLRAILQKPDGKNDLARVKLTIDKMVDPTINIEANLKKIDLIVNQIRSMMGPTPSDSEKLDALQRYIYVPGSWNAGQVFSYDLNDPLGTNLKSKLLPSYLETRKGNCVSMPFLFIILGQRLGLDITASTAPSHVFAKYTDRTTGKTINLEATSGGLPSRDEWMRQQNPMTDAAIKNGIYMQRLSKKETIAVMAEELSESYTANRQFKKSILISDIILEAYPKNAQVMVRKGFCFFNLWRYEFADKYRTANDIPNIERSYFQYLSHEKEFWYDQAEALGWERPTTEEEKSYLIRVRSAKASTP
jgi:regulator of sirC expression with transglutaminase-like and TPR domain